MCEVYESIFRETLKDFRVSEGGQISGYCDSSVEVEKLLDDLRSVGFSYCVRSSHKQPNADVMESPKKFFFQQLMGNVHVPFFGPAFAVESSWSRHCVLGPKYYKSREIAVPEHLEDHVNPRKKRLRIMDTKKRDCPATLNMKCISVFPEYTIQSVNEKWEKPKVLAKLRHDLELPQKPKSFLRFCLIASPATEHNHDTESVEASGHIHPLIVKEIERLVVSGVTTLKFIKLALDMFVESTFTGAHKPGRMNTTFYPTDKTIYTHMYRTLYGTKKVLFDEIRLQGQVDKWRNESNHHAIHYRKCTGVIEEVRPLLFCYQSSWQRDLLKKYGHSCLLDATYKTSSYDIPLFFIAVKGNVGYFVVGFFFIQVENARSIHEALQIFKGWNEDWNPTYWVTDFSESEINAIEQTFPQTKVYLCAFHRKQAWGRWLKSRDNLMVPEDKTTLLDMWQHISESPTDDDFRGRTEELRTHEVSRRNEKAWRYFEQQWLSVHQRWVKAFEEKGNFDTIDTTNGVEAMNKMVKHNFLIHNSDRTLTGVTRVLINDFLPSLNRKYSLENSALKSYNKELPLFLHKKTKKFVKHVMQRWKSAEAELTSRSVNMISDGLFCVESAVSKECNYVVNFDEPNCTCEDFQRYKYPCKHFCAIFIFLPEWGFDKMPESYRNLSSICLDEEYGVGSNRNNSLVDMLEVGSSVEAVEEIDVETNVEDQVPVPNIPSQQFAVREACKQIYNLTYNCSNSETLLNVLESLSNCVQQLQLSNPEVCGLPIGVPSTSKQ